MAVLIIPAAGGTIPVSLDDGVEAQRGDPARDGARSVAKAFLALMLRELK
ncbi:hypothetical protein [Burkholderia ubonensis]|nr:hypothetical protein [Burkholderia ubonensis]